MSFKSILGNTKMKRKKFDYQNIKEIQKNELGVIDTQDQFSLSDKS